MVTQRSDLVVLERNLWHLSTTAEVRHLSTATYIWKLAHIEAVRHLGAGLGLYIDVTSVD